jgi:OOP family OmpA-OmpF porin
MKRTQILAIALFTLAFANLSNAGVVNNWLSASGEVWKNASGECWRNASWTPATAAPGCDGAIVEEPKMAPAPAPAPVAPPAPQVESAPPVTQAAPPAPAPAPAPVSVSSKVTYAADTFFDFNKSVIKPEAKAKLDDLVDKIKAINLEVIIAVGHTDAVGSDVYNQKLSMRRSNAVKAYLISKGVDKTRIYTEGKGEKQPVADNSTKEGRAKNRRVEIEVVGARKN